MNSALSGVRIAGISAAVPRHCEEILETDYISPESRRRFVQTTGVERRRRVAPDQWTSDLAVAAAEGLLAELDWKREEIGALVFVTQSPDLKIPATACVIQDRLGLSTHCGAFDVNLGCSGYTYGLQIAGSLLSEKGIRRALLLAGDTAGKNVFPSMRGKVAPLFGDAASATALEFRDDAPEMLFDLRTDGSEWDAIHERRPGGRPGLPVEDFKYEPGELGEMQVSTKFKMKGEDVFNFSVREVPPAVTAMLERAGKSTAEVDAFVFHQANMMINAFIAKRLGLDDKNCPTSLADFGNTSSATIPVTIVDKLRELVSGGPSTLLMCGFGVGLSWATALAELDGIACPEMIEV